MSEPLIIVGNGMAAVRLVETITQRALGRYAIAVVGDEPCLPYNRVLLSSVLAHESSQDDIELKPARWWKDRGVTLLYGHRATAIDPAIKRVRLASGATLPYSKLVLATGSSPVRPNIPGMQLRGVTTFRNLEDVSAIEAAAVKGAKVAVVGGGLLGLEAAYGLAKAGAQVVVIHLMDRLMERQLDPQAASMLKRALEARGIAVHLNAETTGISGTGRVEAVKLKGRVPIDTDMVIVAVGIRPNTDLARTAGLSINRGIIVGDTLRTSDPHIYGLGECVEHCGVCYGLVEPGYEQARVLAMHFNGERAYYSGSVQATNLKVSGVNVFSAGDFLGAPDTGSIVLSDPGASTYKKLVLKNGRLVGAVLFGDTVDGLWYLELIRTAKPIAYMRQDLVFGRAVVELAA